MDILCTDKTGTLTEDEVILEKYMDVNGNESLRILKHAFLNSYFQTGLKNLIDVAIISRAEKEKMNVLKEKYVREDEIPFDFSRRRMSVVLRDDNGKRQLITKGAVDEVLDICSFIDIDGDAIDMTPELKKKAYEVYEKHNDDGLRVLAVAQKNEIHGVETFGVQDESNMVLIGFVGFLDPPKASAKEAINKLKDYGVDTVVLTGDSEGVALNVCKKVGITVKNRMTGVEVDKLNDEELKLRIEECHLYSKLSPLQKQRIVRLYQENGHTVGYMGDGINDSPPLKQADVGISVDTAVDIAKETADIILLEKDLNVLEEGVVTGRRIFTNVLKYIKMATSGNFGNMLSIVFAMITVGLSDLIWLKASKTASISWPSTSIEVHPKDLNLSYKLSIFITSDVLPSYWSEFLSTIATRLEQLKCDADITASHTDPSLHSPSPKITYTFEEELFFNFNPIEQPTPIESPWPRLPVEYSIPKERFLLGWALTGE